MKLSHCVVNVTLCCACIPMKLLEGEEVRHKEEFELCKDALRTYEASLRERTVHDIQAWWASTLALRRSRNQHARVVESRWRHRVRRLVKLKKAIDHFRPDKITLSQLEDIFCDLVPELREYRLYKKTKVNGIATRWGLKLLAKARVKLSNGLWKQQRMDALREEARLARQLLRNEEVRVAEELRQDLSALAEELAKREYTCPRFECNRRKFLSKERFTTHMKVSLSSLSVSARVVPSPW